MFKAKPRTLCAISKTVDGKFGKGFCKMVVMQTLNPMAVGQVCGSFVKEAAVTAARTCKGIKGPMRTSGKIPYTEKCDIFITLFGNMVSTKVSKKVLDEYKTDVLFTMVDNGAFVSMDYEGFIATMRSLFATLPNVDAEYIDLYLTNVDVQRDLQKLWLS